MRDCKILWLDCKEGIVKNKRIWIMVPVVLLYSMLTHIELDIIWENIAPEYGPYSLFELFWINFSGCDPLIKAKAMTIPYPWLAMYICPVFMTFDYMQQDLLGYGSQMLFRIGSRKRWWYQKCIWCFISALWIYLLMWITMAVFCLINHIPVSFTPNPNTIAFMATESICYTPVSNTLIPSPSFTMTLLVCPLLSMFTMELLTMTLTLFVRPAIAFIINVGILTLSITFDWTLLFPRIGMLMKNDLLYSDAYSLKKGIILCISFITVCMIGGGIVFRYKDILPGKEEEP